MTGFMLKHCSKQWIEIIRGNEYVMKILFRADASRSLGAGHIMRCLTLANAAAERNATSVFASYKCPPHLIEQITKQGHVHQHLVSEISTLEFGTLAKDIAPDWIVIDHYNLDSSWEHACKTLGAKTMAIDDTPEKPHCTEIILDQTYGRKLSDYCGNSPLTSTHLLGVDFALLRPEFSKLRAASLKKDRSSIRRILIAIGGGDPLNSIPQVLDSLSMAPDAKRWQIDVVMGDLCDNFSEVQQAIARTDLNASIFRNVPNIGEFMSEADLAIGASGGSTWERLCLGLPSIQLVVADNQIDVARSLMSTGATSPPIDVRRFGWKKELLKTLSDIQEGQKLNDMMKRGSQMVDGHGAQRVISALYKTQDS